MNIELCVNKIPRKFLVENAFKESFSLSVDCKQASFRKMKKTLETIILLLILLTVSESRKKNKKNKNEAQRQEIIDGCLINLPKDIPKNEPVYLNNELEIYQPIGKQMRFKTDELISIFCPTKNNKIMNGKIDFTVTSFLKIQ
jgi:hypothetical protein